MVVQIGPQAIPQVVISKATQLQELQEVRPLVNGFALLLVLLPRRLELRRDEQRLARVGINPNPTHALGVGFTALLKDRFSRYRVEELPIAALKADDLHGAVDR